jgi:hypothetical protein
MHLESTAIILFDGFIYCGCKCEFLNNYERIQRVKNWLLTYENRLT